MILAAAVGTAILLAIVLSINWFPTHASTQINRTSTLYDVLLIASVPIFVIVETVVVFCVWRFRMRPGEELKDGPPIHGNTRLEVVWTVIPALLMFGLAGYAYTVLRANEANKSGAMTVQVTTRQFAFEFTYPHQDGKTVISPILYLPKGKPVVFKIRSYDVVHSFFVPNFAEKIDAVPGITTTLRVTPNRIGTYPAECTELCGPGHSFMRAAVQVMTPSAFQAWLSRQPNNGPPPIGAPPSGVSAASSKGPAKTSKPTAAAGKAVFTSAAGCSTCHTLAAAGATGTIGPNLDQRLRSDCAKPASKRIRGPTLEQCIHAAITRPYAYIPSGFHAGIMPADFAKRLTSAQIAALVKFLSSAAK
ncbi:MAG: cytochrome c oxidase subunit II [Solirubrobacterales bacterium]|nr:cytochrome c oxidase subunit II [Solirubrobacterales bacterium]MBV9166166.1 cytochrome c oxidase subunit II [Solirubrobacterales bacterium]